MGDATELRPGPCRMVTDDEVERVRDERPWPGGALVEDVSVGDYVATRLGTAVVDRLVEPLLGGVYAGHAGRLSLRATVPVLWERATRGESLLAPATARPASDTRPASDAVAGARPPFAGLRGGVGRGPRRARGRGCARDRRETCL